MLSFWFLDCCKALSECRLTTHSIDVLGCLLQHRGTYFFDLVWNSGRPSPWDLWWCYDNGCSADMRVAEWTWVSLRWHDSRQVNIDWSEWIGKDSMCYIPTCTTRTTLPHARRDNHSSPHCHGGTNMEVILVEKAPQGIVCRVWRNKVQLSWEKSNRQNSKMSVVFLRAEHYEVRTLRGCVV